MKQDHGMGFHDCIFFTFLNFEFYLLTSPLKERRA